MRSALVKIGMKFVTSYVANFFFLFRHMVFKTINNMQNSDFRQKQHFLLQKKKFQVWAKQAIFGRTRQIIS